MTSVYSIVAFTPNKYGGQIRKGLQYNGAQGLNRGNSRSRFTKYCQTAMPKDRWETTAAKPFFYFIWLVDNQLNNNPGTVAMYLTDRSNTKIFELQKVSGCGRKASWMIDHSLYKGTFSLHREHIMPCWSLNLFIHRRFAVSCIARGSAIYIFTDFRTCEKQGRSPAAWIAYSNVILNDDICRLAILRDGFESWMKFSVQSMWARVARSRYLSDLRDLAPRLCIYVMNKVRKEVQALLITRIVDMVTTEVTEDIRMYRLSDDKVLSWLQKKTDSLLSKFEQIPALANSASEICSGTESESEKVDIRRREAVYLLSKYLSKSWFSKLLESYG